MTQSPDIAELQNLTADEIAERIPSLSLDQLKALRELESKESPRKGVIDPVDAAIAAFEAKGNTPAAGKQNRQNKQPRQATAPAAEAKGADDTPDWQREAYEGPLTIPQAEWRAHNVKPVREARTK